MLQKQKPYIAAILIPCSYAGMFLLSKATFSSGLMKPCVFVAYRQAFGTLALAPFAFFFNKSDESPPLTWLSLCKIFIVSSMGLAVCLNINYAGLNYTSPTLASALLSINPPLVFIMSACLRIESLAISQWHGRAKVLGTILGLSGAMAFTFYKGPPLFSKSDQTPNNHYHSSLKTHTKVEWIEGSLLSLASQFLFSMWITIQAPLLKQCPGKLRLTVLQCGFSCLTATIYAGAVERNINSWKLGWNINLISVAYCGIVVAGISYWLQALVIEEKGPLFSAIFNPLALILAAILSSLFLKEKFYWGSVLGGALVVGGLYSFLWGKSKEAQNKLDPSKEEAHLECNRSSIDTTH